MFKVAACLYDRCTRTLEEAGLSSWREELLSTLEGEVLEIGAGTGHNLAFYPKSVNSIVLSEPDRNMRSVLLSTLAYSNKLPPSEDNLLGRSGEVPGRDGDGDGPGVAHAGDGPGGGHAGGGEGHVSGGGPKIRVIDAAAEHLPFPDESFDAVVGTLVLCSVKDLDESLREVFRVLRPGGTFGFIEHVGAVDRPARLRWQRRIEPIWRKLAGNCHLTRSTGDAIEAAGFEIDSMVYASMHKAPALVRLSIRGIARRPEADAIG